MIVVTANWGLSDGTLMAGSPRRVVSALRQRVRLEALRCGVRDGVRYRPVDAVDIVFAGDTFDWLVSGEWTGTLRPWCGGRRVAEVFERVAFRALQRSARLWATLADWARRGIVVPKADHRGRPTLAETCRVPVRVVVLEGDREPHLEQLAARRGGSVPIAVGRSWSAAGVGVRHGEDLDVLCLRHGGAPTLAESLSVELFAAFGAAVIASGPLRSAVPRLLRHLSRGLPHDAGIRLYEWMEFGDGAVVLSGSDRRKLADIWNRTVAAWHSVAAGSPAAGDTGIDEAAAVAERLELRRERFPQPSAWRLHRSPPVAMAGFLDADSLTILGHPAPDGQPRGGRHRVLAVGPRGLPPGGHPDDDAISACSILPGDHGGFAVAHLPLVQGSRGGGVWISPQSPATTGVIDAA